MHIKQVIIQGFKTYKDRTEIEPFSPGHNVIVGRNGSGKSNILDAIQFVLSDKYASLRKEQRQALLHEGSGREVMSATVEVIFDNADRRFPVEKDDVSIKRTIGLKKDEFFLDEKHVSKADVVNLLESAGLSRSNPYYIVPQGKVVGLIRMKDSERLELLKEIAGTRTYDERKKESMKIMEDTDQRRKQIDEVIEYIEKRLNELRGEQKELQEFQKLDTERVTLEYTIYDKELTEAKEELEKIDGQRESFTENAERLFNNAQEAEKKLSDTEEQLTKTQGEIAKYKTTKTALEKELRKLVEKRTRIELQVNEEASKATKDKKMRQDADVELKKLAKDIKTKTKKLEQVSSEFDTKLKEETQLKERYQFCEQRLNTLYDKQGRSKQFKSKAQRDTFLKKKLKGLEEEYKDAQSEITKITNNSELAKENIAKAIAELEAKAAEKTRLKTDYESAKDQVDKIKEQRDKASNERKELWRQEHELESRMKEAQELLENASRQLQISVDRNQWRGVQSAMQGAKEEKIPGVYGPLITLFTCDKTFEKCVETTAGNSLWSIVVEDDDAASKIIKYLNKKKSGRCTFMPLNVLRKRMKIRQYPRNHDAIAMVEKLAYDSKFEPAIQQIFGRTLITRDLSVAAIVAREHNFDAITLGGDQVNKRGALTGGYSGTRSSRLAFQKEINEAQGQVDTLSEQLKGIQNLAQAKDQEVSKLVGEIQKERAKKDRVRGLLEAVASELESVSRRQDQYTQTVFSSSRSLREMENNAKQIEANVKALKDELKADFLDELSDQDKKEVHELTAEVTTLKEKLLQATSVRTTAESEKSRLEVELKDNLLKREGELKRLIEMPTQEEATDQLEGDTHELDRAVEEVKEAEIQLKDAEGKLDVLTKKSLELQESLDKLKNEEANQKRAVQKETRTMEKLMSKRSALLQKVDQANSKIRDLGALPSGAFDKYKDKSVAQVMKLLENANKKLKKFSHVNKKAIDQFKNFTDQRQKLQTRKEELDKGRQSIMELIAHLDMKKDEAIERTFKGIAKNFSDVFTEIVPGGKATLVIKTQRADDEEDEEEEEEEEEEKKGKGKSKKGKSKKGKGKGKGEEKKHYTGIAMKVSFSGRGKDGEGQQTMGLSGGQKTVVALSLIFAIQRCDPSPFYIFDEIDFNLDSVYRSAVAQLIHSQAGEQKGKEKVQFITTTFRPEMIEVADKFYGVVFQNKVSRINVIQRDEARSIIAVVEREIEAQRKKRAGGSRDASRSRSRSHDRDPSKEREQSRERSVSKEREPSPTPEESKSSKKGKGSKRK